MDDFDIEDEGYGNQHYEGGLIEDEGNAHSDQDNIDWTGGSRSDFDRTGAGKGFEKRDLYDMSLEGKLMIEVKGVLGTYNFNDSKSRKIEDAIKKYDVKLKQSNAGILVAAVIFLLKYQNDGGLTKKNVDAFEKERRQSIKKLDLIRYVRFLQTLGVEV